MSNKIVMGVASFSPEGDHPVSFHRDCFGVTVYLGEEGGWLHGQLDSHIRHFGRGMVMIGYDDESGDFPRFKGEDIPLIGWCHPSALSDTDIPDGEGAVIKALSAYPDDKYLIVFQYCR